MPLRSCANRRIRTSPLSNQAIELLVGIAAPSPGGRRFLAALYARGILLVALALQNLRPAGVPSGRTLNSADEQKAQIQWERHTSREGAADQNCTRDCECNCDCGFGYRLRRADRYRTRQRRESTVPGVDERATWAHRLGGTHCSSTSTHCQRRRHTELRDSGTPNLHCRQAAPSGFWHASVRKHFVDLYFRWNLQGLGDPGRSICRHEYWFQG